MAATIPLPRLRRALLLAGGLLILLYLALAIGTAPSEGPQIVLPDWMDIVPLAGLALLVASQGVAVAAERGGGGSCSSSRSRLPWSCSGSAS